MCVSKMTLSIDQEMSDCLTVIAVMKKFHGSRVPIPNRKKITATRPLSRLERQLCYIMSSVITKWNTIIISSFFPEYFSKLSSKSGVIITLLTLYPMLPYKSSFWNVLRKKPSKNKLHFHTDHEPLLTLKQSYDRFHDDVNSDICWTHVWTNQTNMFTVFFYLQKLMTNSAY